MAKNEKQRRYRERMRAQGRCERCGKSAFPFSLCDTHRFYKRVSYNLNRAARAGLFIKTPDARYAVGRLDAPVTFYDVQDDDSRRSPRPYQRRTAGLDAWVKLAD